MAKLYKLEVYVTDMNDTFIDGEDVVDSIEMYLGDRFGASVHKIKVEETKEFEWDDDLRINYRDATTEDFDKQFEKERN